MNLMAMKSKKQLSALTLNVIVICDCFYLKMSTYVHFVSKSRPARLQMQLGHK